MRRVFSFIVLFILFAEPTQAKKVQVRKVQEINFEETELEGKAKSPEAAYLAQKKGVEFLPIYRVKRNFDKKVKESVSYLR